jgi:hypothetical protein
LASSPLASSSPSLFLYNFFNLLWELFLNLATDISISKSKRPVKRKLCNFI